MRMIVDDRETCTTLCRALDVARDDPYFFDHPLDHVPDLALVAGLLDLARADGGRPEAGDRRVTVSFRFPRFCELAEPVELLASHTPDTVALLARQGDLVTCEGGVTFHPTPEAEVELAPPTALFDTPAEAELVHRTRLENVMVSTVAEFPETRVVAVRPPVDGHFLATPPGMPIRMETVIDAARQFGIMLFHREYGKPRGTRFVLTSIDAEWHCDLGSTIFLRWVWTPPPRGRFTMRFNVLTGGPDGEPCGLIEFEAITLSPAGYDRMRARARAERPRGDPA